jgi:hypothetical protein
MITDFFQVPFNNIFYISWYFHASAEEDHHIVSDILASGKLPYSVCLFDWVLRHTDTV